MSGYQEQSLFDNLVYCPVNYIGENVKHMYKNSSTDPSSSKAIDKHIYNSPACCPLSTNLPIPPSLPPPAIYLTSVRQDTGQDIHKGIPRARLHTVTIVPPPRPRRPPKVSRPHIAIRLQILQPALQGRDASRITPARILAEESLLVVGAQPICGGGEALLEDGGGNAFVVRAGSVNVEVLVHLVDYFGARGVGGVRERDEGAAVAGGDPGPGTCDKSRQPWSSGAIFGDGGRRRREMERSGGS